MSDEQPPGESDQEEVAYWHDEHTSAGATAGRVVSALIGMVGGFLAVVVLGAFIALAGGQQQKLIFVIGLLWICLALACAGGLWVKLRNRRHLALGELRRASRFFVIGLLIGCGVACLVEGICFSGGSAAINI